MTTMRTWITVRSTFEGFHRYPKAPDAVAFLRDMHRHIFHVTESLTVTEDDREIEFFILQDFVKVYTRIESRDDSCEMIARRTLDRLKKQYPNREYRVTVSEDGENEATIEELKGDTK